MTARLLLALMLGLLLAGCGFHLRGQADMPFSTLYLKVPNEHSDFAVELKRSLAANGVRLAAKPEEAEMTLVIDSEGVQQKILSLAATGRAQEYQLLFVVVLHSYDKQHSEWMPTQTVVARREYSYSDSVLLAKQEESQTLIQDMQRDMVQQILRRLSVSHAHPHGTTEP